MAFAVLSPAELQGWIRDGKPVVLVDVLVDEHFKAVHLPGAVNACVYEIVFLSNIAGLIPDRDREVVLYGSGETSLEALTAAEKLVQAGYRNVGVLQGGLAAWRAQGYDLEGEDLSAPEGPVQALPADDVRCAVDPGQSVIHWFGRNRTTTHRGTLRVASGHLRFPQGGLEGAFEIDMQSIRNIDLEGDPLQPQLIAHLHSEDFFYVRMFPKAFFTIQSARRVGDVPSSLPNFRVQGILDLRGEKQEIEFPATASALQDGQVRIEAHFDIDRTRWGVLYGASRFFENLGYHLVYNPISLQIRLVVRPAGSGSGKGRDTGE